MLEFRSLRSGSSGNLLLIESHSGRRPTRVLIDCGINSQRECARILDEEVGSDAPIDGVVVSHAHCDHINYSALRVLGRRGIPVYAHRRTKPEIESRCWNPYRVPESVDPGEVLFRCFSDDDFEIGAFRFRPIPVPHAPGITTHAFLIERGRQRVLWASDLSDPEALLPHIYDCDFVYLESNHDLELLRLQFNPASLFHLSNPAAGLLLRHTLAESRRLPRAVMLAHLSEDRNRPQLALRTVREAVGAELAEQVPLIAAPRYGPSETIVVAQ
ncbi:MAG: MBL fold metallo-hydrolase [Candidatus Eisenbacteria bacterium]|nr:MBL fold metallo-hydrolase [Candidatus Eisenbacteria bacterium]